MTRHRAESITEHKQKSKETEGRCVWHVCSGSRDYRLTTADGNPKSKIQSPKLPGAAGFSVSQAARGGVRGRLFLARVPETFAS